MQTYIGSRLVKATPMTQQAFSTYTSGEHPAYESPDTEGFLLEDPKGSSNHPDHSGQISWMHGSHFRSEFKSIALPDSAPDYLQRLAGELVLLQQKLTDLQIFFKSDKFLKLQFTARDLLQEQARVMSRYITILEERLAFA